MRIPRDIGGDELGKLLKKYGYEMTRQTGSHVRLTSKRKNEHHLTIPRHKSLRIGTLHSILREIAVYHEINFDELVESLFKQ